MNTYDLADLEAYVILAERAEGRTPPGMFRPTFPHEQFVNFAEIDDILGDGYRRTAEALDEVRNSILDAMSNAWDLPPGESEKLARAIREFGAAQSPQIRQVVDKSVREIADAMASVNHRSAAGLVREAARQGVSPARTVSLVRGARYADMASAGPAILWSRLNAAAAQVVTPRVTPAEVIRAAETVSVAQATDTARQGVHVAAGDGRLAGIDTLREPSDIYASELLDGRTCDRCARVDGRRYANLEAAMNDYPGAGPYWNCRGGARCRGTLVVVYEPVDPDDPTAPKGPRLRPDQTGPLGDQSAGQTALDVTDVTPRPPRKPKQEPEPPAPAREIVDEVPVPAEPARPMRDPSDMTVDEIADEMTAVMGRYETAAASDYEALDELIDRLAMELERKEAAAYAAEQAEQQAAARLEAKRIRDRERAQERRDQKRAEREADDYARQDRIGQLIDEGYDEANAIAEAYEVPVDRVQRKLATERLRADGYTGRGFDELSRRAWADEVRNLYAAAEEETIGYFLNAEARRINAAYHARGGKGRYIDDELLFHGGSEAFVRKWAAPELNAYWSANGRMTLESFREELLTGRRGRLYEGDGSA